MKEQMEREELFLFLEFLFQIHYQPVGSDIISQFQFRTIYQYGIYINKKINKYSSTDFENQIT